MRIWWVNQNQTYKHEVGGGYLWSPKTNKNGRRNHFYDTMTETALGDIVFSFSDTQIKAVGVVSGACMSAPKPPEFGSAGSNWSDEGWWLTDFKPRGEGSWVSRYPRHVAGFVPERYSLTAA